MPRSNNSQSDNPTPSRSRGTTGTASPRTRTRRVDAAADRSTPATGGTSAETAAYSPTYDEIAEAAYHRYLRRGGSDGQDVDDWVEAERELKSSHSS